MSRSRSFSSSWTDRSQPPRIATVKPVSKSLSEDDLLKVSEDETSLTSPTRVFTRFNVQDLSLLKKDNIIGELEKCLQELESEHGYAQRLGDVYEKVESERNQLLDELDMAFQDLQQYMHKQKQIEDEKTTIETDREELNKENEELQKENEYLKAVLSNRNEIVSNRLQEENHQYAERIKELETKNGQHLDEINELYEERQTLITSLLNLQSAEVEDVIRKTSRSSSLCSRESLDDLDVSASVQDILDQINDGDFDKEAYVKTLKELQSENEELKEAFKRIRKERDTAEQEIDQLKEEKDHVDQAYAEKIRDFQSLQEDRNEKNLNLSKLNLEKRTLQRQYDHMRETNRSLNIKISTLTKEIEIIRDKPRDRILSAPSSHIREKSSEDDLSVTSYNISRDDTNLTPPSLHPTRQEHVDKEDGVPQRKDSASQRSADMDLNEKVKRLELKNNELKTENIRLEEDLNNSENMCITISQKYDSESESNKRLQEVCDVFKKELSELKAESSSQYSDLVVEYDNVRNYNQQLQNTIDKVRSEKEIIKSELNNYKCDVIEKIKQNLDALEKERVSLLSEKESLEMTVKVKQESEQELKETCSKLLKQVDETKEMNRRSKNSSECEDINIIQRKYDVLQKDYDRMLQKCRQLEKSVADGAGFTDELKRLKDANEMLLQRYRSLEADYDLNLKSSEDEKQKYSGLLLKYENKSKQYDIGCQQYDTLEREHKEACDNYDELVRENNNLCQQYDDLHRQHKQTCNKYDGLIKENKNLVEKVNKCNCERVDIANTNMTSNKNDNQTIIKNLQNEKGNIQNEKNDLQKERNELEKRILSLTEEVNQLLESKKVSEVTSAALENKQQRIEKERDMYQTKYDHICVDFDKITKEKAHFALTVETLRDENRRLNEAVRKQRLVTSSSQDLTLQKLQDENESFHQQIDLLQSNLSNAINENKRLLERINRSDENVAATIRSLKTRKNELQLQVETLKHENDYLKKIPKTKEKKYKFGKTDKTDKNSELLVNESLRNAHAKMAELQLENDEVRRKLHEYEGLLNEQHQALAHANDLAMQKNLEGSKMKRSLEKRMDKITKENNELRRIIFLLDDTNINNLTPKNSPPPVVQKPKTSEHSVVNITFSTDDNNSTSEADRTPQLISVATVSNPRNEQSVSSVSSVPESPRLATSRQLENDLSIQLRELLDLSNDISPSEDDQRSHISEESVAPPVPPPPPNYGSSSRRYNFRMPFFRLKRK